ncbi:MAG: hypothetical protein EXQ77_00025 [Thermoleophilia bacterium]|nr:hypothetical protein [Thermoleophilia bacterium]
MLALVLGGAALALAAYGWFEAGWVRFRVRELELSGLPPALDGLRIAHLSDLHLGAPGSRGDGAALRAARWVEERRPDLVCVTGDLVAHPRGAEQARRVFGRLGHAFVVAGNQEEASTRDPFARGSVLGAAGVLGESVLLRDRAATVQARGARVQIVGVDPATFAAGGAEPDALADAEATLRILLCHFPGIADMVVPDAFHLVLAGHLHDGQIALPLPGRRLGLAHPRERFLAGPRVLRGGGVLHISPGLGTTFVPFRFLARPEVTELVLRAAGSTIRP